MSAREVEAMMFGEAAGTRKLPQYVDRRKVTEVVRALQRHYLAEAPPPAAEVDTLVDDVLDRRALKEALQRQPSEAKRDELEQYARSVARLHILGRFVARDAGYEDLTQERRARGLVNWEALYEAQRAAGSQAERDRIFEEALGRARERMAEIVAVEPPRPGTVTVTEEKIAADRRDYARAGRELATMLRAGNIAGAVDRISALARPTARGAARLWQDAIATTVRMRDVEGLTLAMARLCDLLARPGVSRAEAEGVSRAVAPALKHGLRQLDPIRDADVAAQLAIAAATSLHSDLGVRRYRAVLLGMAEAGHALATVSFASRVVRDVPDVADNMFLSAAFDGLRKARALDALVELVEALAAHDRLEDWMPPRVARTCLDLRDACGALDFFRLCVDRGWPLGHDLLAVTLRAALAGADLERAAQTLQEAVPLGILPTASDVSTVLALCQDLREPSGATELVLQCRQLGVGLTDRHYQALADVHDAAEDADGAIAVLRLMADHGAVPTPILLGYLAGTAAKHGRPDLVRAVAESARETGQEALDRNAIVSASSHVRRLLARKRGAAAIHATPAAVEAASVALADLLAAAVAHRAEEPALRNAVLPLCAPLADVDVRAAARVALIVLDGAAKELAAQERAAAAGDDGAEADAGWGSAWELDPAGGAGSGAAGPPAESFDDIFSEFAAVEDGVPAFGHKAGAQATRGDSAPTAPADDGADPAAEAGTAAPADTSDGTDHNRGGGRSGFVPEAPVLRHVTVATVTRLLARCFRDAPELGWELVEAARAAGLADTAMYTPVMRCVVHTTSAQDAMRVLRSMEEDGLRADKRFADLAQKGVHRARREGSENEYRRLAASVGVSLSGADPMGHAAAVNRQPRRGKQPRSQSGPSRVTTMSQQFRDALAGGNR